jgi:hypothetical protein
MMRFRASASALGGVLILLGLLFGDAHGAHKLRVVTTIPDFKALVAGAKSIVVPTMVGGVKGVDSYMGTIDYNVTALAQALR